MDVFAVLHELDDTQFLVNTGYEHEFKEHWLTYKFWSESINGYIEAKLHWPDEKEIYASETFEKFKSVEYFIKFKQGTEAKFLGQ